jgi:uncharacterized membrane protein
MDFAARAINGLRKVGPYIVGTAVWGSVLVLMIHGLLMGAWYGYAFAGMLAVFGMCILVIMVRGRRRAASGLNKSLSDEGA